MAEPPSELTDETLDLLFDLVREAPDKQVAVGDVHDAKAFKFGAAASVLLGFVALVDVPGKLLWGIVMSYVIVLGSVLWTVRPRGYHVVRHADSLWEQHWNETPRAIKHAVVAEAANAYKTNRALLRSKLSGLVFAVVALGIEAIFVAITVLDA